MPGQSLRQKCHLEIDRESGLPYSVPQGYSPDQRGNSRRLCVQCDKSVFSGIQGFIGEFGGFPFGAFFVFSHSRAEHFAVNSYLYPENTGMLGTAAFYKAVARVIFIELLTELL